MTNLNVLHVLYTYFPDVTGSTIRSEGLLTGLKSQGVSVTAVTSPFQRGLSQNKVEVINDIEIHRTFDDTFGFGISEVESSIFVRIKKLFSVFYFAKQIEQIGRKKNVTILHAHSMFYCAFASYLAAKRLNVPLVYEFRSLWEERFNKGGPINLVKAKLIKFMETIALKSADEVVVINEGLKSEVIKRGISQDKIVVVPNAVAQSIIDLSKTSKVPSKINVFGYVGNYSEIEGLNLLIEAFKLAFPKNQYIDKKLVFYGRGPYESELESIIAKSMDNRISNLGSFARGDIYNVYADIDCIVNPRKGLKICELVTPLKPLEAMAFKKLLIGSNCKGIVEVTGGKANAIYFEVDKLDSLVSKLKTTINNNYREVICNAHLYVHQERTWHSVSNIYTLLYSKLFKSNSN